MHTYQAFYKHHRSNVEAPTSFDAQKKAAELWKVPTKQAHRISIFLVQKEDGKEVTHSTADL